MEVDNGAEVIVWPPDLFPEGATVEADESRRGAKFFGWRDKTHRHFPIWAYVNTVSKLATLSRKQVLTLFQCGNLC